MATKKTSKTEVPCEAFTRTQNFISSYSVVPTQDDLDLLTLWAMGTWYFSPACPASPYAYPYLYLTGARGSGKSVLGVEVFSHICRNHKPIAMVTGATLFRTLGTYDDETGEIVNHWPTLAIDEIDATYSGGRDEQLRGVVNLGYKRGATVDRAAGKTTIAFPVYCPKLLMGIDNGHLPDTITDRSIRIDLVRANPPQELYGYMVEDEAAEIQQMLSDWAKGTAMVLRDYNPEKIPELQPRQWEIARALVQLARAAGIETRIRTALRNVMTRNPERPDGKVALYRSILTLFSDLDVDRLTTRQILAQLQADNVRVPGDSGKGLSSVLSGDGITPKYIRLRDDHPGITVEADGKVNNVHRGYFRHMFDDAFVEYLEDDE